MSGTLGGSENKAGDDLSIIKRVDDNISSPAPPIALLEEGGG